MRKSSKLSNSLWILILVPFTLIASIEVAHAGMPSVVLTDIAKQRLSTISFFLFIYLLASYGIFYLWNWVQTDFPQIPKLTLKKSMGLVLIWGLAFHLLLVIIAGTRELMTPKAWEKAGIVHQLAPDRFQQNMEMRQRNLAILKQQVWQLAEKNQGEFPSKKELLAISPHILLEATGKLNYNYIEGLTVRSPLQPLAYEPDSYGAERMVLLTNGNIELLSLNAIQELLMENRQ